MHNILHMNIGEMILNQRNNMGLSQVELAARSGVSLPTIQNIEAGRANPAWSTLESLFKILAVEVQLKAKPIDLKLWALHGVPLTSADIQGERYQKPQSSQLKKMLKNLVSQLPGNEDFHRKEWQAFLAFLWALHENYPIFFKQVDKESRYADLLEKTYLHTNSDTFRRYKQVSADKLAEYM